MTVDLAAIQVIVNYVMAELRFRRSPSCPWNDSGPRLCMNCQARELLPRLTRALEEAQRERDELKAAAADARMGHVRLDETRAKDVEGDLYRRIGWLIELLTCEKLEAQHIVAAGGHEKDELRARAEAAEQRRAAAEYRAQRIVIDAELQQRREAKQQLAAPRESSLRALHMSLNVELRRLGVAAPACDGPNCRICAVLA